MSEVAQRALPPAERDAFALLLDGARQALQRGRAAWVAKGGRLDAHLDEALSDYERWVREEWAAR